MRERCIILEQYFRKWHQQGQAAFHLETVQHQAYQPGQAVRVLEIFRIRRGEEENGSLCRYDVPLPVQRKGWAAYRISAGQKGYNYPATARSYCRLSISAWGRYTIRTLPINPTIILFVCCTMDLDRSFFSSLQSMNFIFMSSWLSSTSSMAPITPAESPFFPISTTGFIEWAHPFRY